jgi:GGDEF domain-containing protein
MGPELPSRLFAPDPLTGFGTRAALMADLAVVVDPASSPSVLAIFALDGLDVFEKANGVSRTDELLFRLAQEFARIVCPEGRCYTPRRRELCAHFPVPLVEVSPILAAASISLRREIAMTEMTTAFGVALLPYQAQDPVGALVVADRNLNEARRTQRRARPVHGG